MKLNLWGWSTLWQSKNVLNLNVARITAVHRSHSVGIGELGEVNIEPSGKLRFASRGAEDLPVVGDWVTLSPYYQDESGYPAALALDILPRESCIARQDNYRKEVLAANVDLALIITSVNQDFSVNRLQRYILLAHEGNIKPVVILSKVDLDPKWRSKALELEKKLNGVQVLGVSSAQDSLLLHDLKNLLKNKTSVFLGSSGVGKSTLTNALLGEIKQLTQNIRTDDDKGRHTTTARELFLLPNGGVIIDTPGLREVQIHGDAESLNATFTGLDEMIQSCRFTNCTHRTEPGCAVLDALEKGTLDLDTWVNFQKLQREQAHAERKNDKRLAVMEKERRKKIHKENRRRQKILGK